MAKRTITTETMDSDRDEREEPVEELSDDIIRALAELDGADDVRWQIHRRSQPNPGYCGELSTGEISLYRIAQDYGPGRYAVKGIKPDGKYFKSATITIAEVIKKDSSASLTDMVKKLNGGDQSLMPLMMAMMQNNTQVLVAALNKQTAPTAKEFPWGPFLGAAPALLLAVKDFTRNESDSNAMEKLLKQLTILEKLKGSDKESNWTDIVREAVSTLPGLINARGPVPVTVTQQPPMSDAAMEQRAVELSPTPVSDETNMIVLFLRERLQSLIESAAKNRNPELQAELFLEDLSSLPQAVQQMLMTALNTANWFEQLCQIDPRANNYVGWFDELHTNLLALINDEDSNNERTESTVDRVADR